MTYKKTILATSALLFWMIQAEAKSKDINQEINTSVTAKSNPNLNKPVDHKLHEKIKLNNNSIVMLNISLQQNPIAVLKIRLSAKAVRQVLNALPAEKKKKENSKISAKSATPAEQQFITKQLDAILKPVEEFFDIIQAYSSMVLPILKESLTNHNLLENSLLVEYFSAQEHIKAFSTRKATSFDQLEVLCTELISFFNDLDASFSPEVEAAYRDLLRQLKAPKNTTLTA